MGTLVIPEGGWTIANYKNPEKILLGFEYEIDTRQDSRHLRELISEILPKHYSFAYENLDHNYNYGFEIKSSVAPLLRIKSEINNIKDIIFWQIPKEHTAGGIHININKNEYTQKVHTKIFEFLHNKNNFNWLFKLSRRKEHSFNLFSPQNTPWSFYYGIITTRKSFAYEFRMFQAIPELLIPANEFIHALFDLAGVIEGEITIELMMNFINSTKRYKTIRPYLEDALAN